MDERKSMEKLIEEFSELVADFYELEWELDQIREVLLELIEHIG